MAEITSKTNNTLPLGTVDQRGFTATINNAVQQFQSAQERDRLASLQGGAQAQQALLPYSQTAQAVMGELNDMLGIAPPVGAVGNSLAERLDSMKALITSNESTAKREFAQFTNKLLSEASIALRQADKAVDPQERQKLRAKANKALHRVKNQVATTLQGIGEARRKFGPQKDGSIINEEIYTDAVREIGIMAPIQQELDAVFADFESDFKVTPEQAKSPAEVTKQLESTPGYQFQFDQGQKALERSQAARGLLNSGNAAAELQQYGQGLAQQSYQQHLQNLAQQAGMVIPVAQQQGLLPVNTGQFQSQYGLNAATTRLGSLNNLASNQARAAIATAQNQTSLANAAGAQNNGGLFKGLF